MYQNKTVLFMLLSALLAMAGCSGGETGNGGGGAGSVNVTLSGIVSDGYISGAIVCLDKNKNKKCDVGEPSATTGSGGTYSLDVLPEDAAAYPIIAVVGADAIDEDQPGVAIGNDYVLTTPPGKHAVVSPLTTMINSELEKNPAFGADGAESVIKQKLGYSSTDGVDLYADYVAESNNAGNANKAEYERLHNVAKVVAMAVAANKDSIETALVGTSYTLDDVLDEVIDIIVAQVVQELSTIVTAVDASTPVDTIAAAVSVATTTIESDIDQSKAASSATAATVSDVAEMYLLGYCSFGCVSDTGAQPYTYDYVKYSFANSNFSGGRAFLTGSGWYWDPATVTDTADPAYLIRERVLGANGWVTPTRVNAVLTDGELSLVYKDAMANSVSTLTYLVSKINISGLPIKTTIANYKMGLELAGLYGVETFDIDAEMYLLSLQQSSDYYSRFVSNSPYSLSMTSVNELLTESVKHYYSVYTETNLSTYQYALVGSASDATGVVNFFSYNSTSGLYDIPVADGTWDKVTQGGVEILRVKPPVSISAGDTWPSYPAFAMDSDGLHMFEYIPAGTIGSTFGLFNKAGLNMALTALSQTTVP